MMSSPTKVFEGWTGSVRRFFNMSSSQPTKGVEAPSPGGSEQKPSETRSHDSHDIAEESFISAHFEINEPVKTIQEQMEEAKQMYPGSKEWARDEERLFEILYLRQDIPILPSHWNVDFRGFPIPEEIFETSHEHPSRVYAHLKSGAKEYSATAALTKLIDLTLSVRTIIESERPDHPREQQSLRHRASELIKDSLGDYLSWAARDGGYQNKKVLNNIVVEVVDAPDTQEDIVGFMMDRMRALARLQREFYRVDRKPSFWSSTKPWTMATDAKKRKMLKNKRRARDVRRKYTVGRFTTPEMGWDELSAESIGAETPMDSLNIGPRKQLVIGGSPSAECDELANSYETPHPSVESDSDALVTGAAIKTERSPTPRLSTLPPVHSTAEPSQLCFRRNPPVVYGLYVIGTSVFLLTMDSSKGDTGYVSFHVDINFADNHQSVWNALTVAIAACAARDELMLRLDDFDMAPVEEYESDPDA